MALLVILPVFVLSIFPNAYLVPKLIFLSWGSVVLLLLICIKVIVSGNLNISGSRFDLPIFIILLSYLASTFLKTPNYMEAILTPGSATILVSSVILYFSLNQLGKDKKIIIRRSLFASGVVFSIITLLSFSGIMGKLPFAPAALKSENVTPEGGYLPAAVFLFSLLPIVVGVIMKEKDSLKKTLFVIAGLFVALAFVVSVYNIFPGGKNAPQFPSLGTSWSITVDTLKQSPFLGIGPGNYLTAFNRFRPIEYNNTNLWAIKFSTASNYYFTLITETGLVGMAGILLLLFMVYKNVKNYLQKAAGKSSEKKYDIVALSFMIVSLAVFPATLLLVFTLFILLSLNTSVSTAKLNLAAEDKKGNRSKLPAIVITAPVIALSLFFFFYSARVIKAEHSFRKALTALGQNQGRETYDYLTRAINTNPRVDRYHATFARVHLLLANNIARKEEITDEDRQNITRLVQQAIRESKATVSLNPTRSGNWEVLARTYRAISPLASGADQFAVQTYRQAVALDPINPNLRINLGSAHFARGDVENAIRSFELAVAAKRDLANAHFNLSFAYKENGDIEKAINEMQVVLSLVGRDSNDYEVARQALEALEEERQTAETPEGDELTTPEKDEEGVLEPPIELTEEEEPPEAEITPTPAGEGEENAENVSGSPTPTGEEYTSITPSPTSTQG